MHLYGDITLIASRKTIPICVRYMILLQFGKTEFFNLETKISSCILGKSFTEASLVNVIPENKERCRKNLSSVQPQLLDGWMERTYVLGFYRLYLSTVIIIA